MSSLTRIEPMDGLVNDNNDVNGRKLWEALKVKTDFDKWMPRMIEYGFSENDDYSTFLAVGKHGGKPAKEYLLSMDMAKEISMLQRSELGSQWRKYFIEV
ncbi:antA/AntB antirepressor family protein, partial [Weissella muntiaci]